MKPVVVTVLLLIALASPALAQEDQSTPASPENSSSPVGTDPAQRGATGWTGGAREPAKGPASRADTQKTDPEAATNQPFMATGEDLNGAPAQFPASKTPE